MNQFKYSLKIAETESVMAYMKISGVHVSLNQYKELVL